LTRIRCAFVYSVKHHLLFVYSVKHHLLFLQLFPFLGSGFVSCRLYSGFSPKNECVLVFSHWYLVDYLLGSYSLFIDLWFSQILSFAHVILCRQWRLLDGTTLQHQTGMSFESQMVEVYWGSYPLPTSLSLLLWLCTCQILLWASDSSCKCPVVECLY
jgi:hypothetical protein